MAEVELGWKRGERAGSHHDELELTAIALQPWRSWSSCEPIRQNARQGIRPTKKLDLIRFPARKTASLPPSSHPSHSHALPILLLSFPILPPSCIFALLPRPCPTSIHFAQIPPWLRRNHSPLPHWPADGSDLLGSRSSTSTSPSTLCPISLPALVTQHVVPSSRSAARRCLLCIHRSLSCCWLSDPSTPLHPFHLALLL